MSFFFVFDVESIGLHGEPYAVGWVVTNRDGEELSSGRIAIRPELACGDADDRQWCAENIPEIAPTHGYMDEMFEDFWSVWLGWKARGALMFAECAWPVEAKFLAMCVGAARSSSKWSGPYPLHDVASVMFAAGMDPMATYERLENERPKHDPLADSRQSARLLVEALNKVSA